MVLICISLVTYDVEHLFICLLAICISSLLRGHLRSLPHYDGKKIVFFKNGATTTENPHVQINLGTDLIPLQKLTQNGL